MRISDWSSDVCSSDLTILIVAQPARRIFIGNKLAVIVDYRISPDVKKRTSLTDLDIFVADTAKQCDIRGNRDSYIGAGIFGFITLIELAGVLTVIPRAHRPAERTAPWLHSTGTAGTVQDRQSAVEGQNVTVDGDRG